MNNKYLLEIGTEEIPARFINSALKQMENKIKELLTDERIQYDTINTYATPRRLVLLIEDIADVQEDLEETVKGPSKKIAYDAEGNPSKALQGFARGQGVALDDIMIKEYNGEEYVYAHKLVKGKAVEDILKGHMAAIIKTIGFPKPMRWGGKNMKFARPIRWIVSLLNDQVIEFDLEGIPASNITKGHRFLGSNHIVVDHVGNYTKLLRENYVIVDQDERKEIIVTGCNRLAKEKGGALLEDADLLEELTYIVEYPTPFIGRIKETYLDLPKEVIITPMKEHQRYYPVEDGKGRLKPYFIAVRNGNEEHIDIVSKGNEKVLEARLEDAKFFYQEDVKKPLEAYVEPLRDIVFQEQLGTIYEKIGRIKALSEKMGHYLELGDETLDNIQRAAHLCKADLVTKMVYEFTELQGVMGREYAKTSGENDIVSLAIYEHYLPRGANDELPTTTAGAALSIADKLDTIAGCFAIGIQPTGSADPYALRRQSLGIINIILDKNLEVSVSQMIDYALEIYREQKGLEFDHEGVKEAILKFFNARIKNMFVDKGIRYDVIDAVLSTDTDSITDLLVRAEELNNWLNKDELTDILAAFNRVTKIAAKAENKAMDEDLFLEPQEKALYDTYLEVDKKVKPLIDQKRYDQALDAIIELRQPIDEFFDHVMVMVEDEGIKNNRLALIKSIADMMMQICDLSKLVTK